MDIDFTKIDYLKNGNDKQKRAFNTLTENEILANLQEFGPLLVGTIPINIDIENSDLDIICYYRNSNEFTEKIKERFHVYKDFKINESDHHEFNAVIAKFRIDDFEIELFGQNIPTRQQYAFRHMMIEYKLLCERGETFRQKIVDLKLQGYKTEVAFGVMLCLTGNPYLELLKFEN
ncbi:DUF4269 domain-containing protein [Marivirga sp. S37H4]|uniref:DUF4269 domain-containing protein n=1 Tax=Marivirga aurantiaca TaxID=2802615 RepID=A0A934WXR3_9BACT|nr:DUF4269 domain-containing protein [Marivirga aurantiaca]MBK6265103.1 DUF4269 domain-containing protein [Marivirga aurantiaca]